MGTTRTGAAWATTRKATVAWSSRTSGLARTAISSESERLAVASSAVYRFRCHRHLLSWFKRYSVLPKESHDPVSESEPRGVERRRTEDAMLRQLARPYL